MAAVGWGIAAGAALSGLLEWGLSQALQAWAVALALATGATALRSVVRAAIGPRGVRLAPGSAALLPAWPPLGQAPQAGHKGLAGGGPWARWAANRAAGGPVPGSLAAWGLGLVVGALMAAARMDAQAWALAALTPPRVAWVAGFAAKGWEWHSFSARTQLRAVRLAESRCPGFDGAGEEGVALPGHVEVVVPDPVARRRPLDGGEWVCVRGVVERPPEVARTGRPLRRILLARGVVATVRGRLPERVRVVAGGVRAPWTLQLRVGLARLARRAAAAVRDRAGPDASSWFQAVALGDRQALGPDLRRQLEASGLSHLTSVSGMHVGLVGGPLLALTGLVRRRRRWRLAGGVAACAAGWAYAAACGLEAPAVRALLMQGFAWVPSLAGWRPDALATLGWAAAVQLATNPHLAVDAGFQMSYAATAGIALAARQQAQRTGWPPAVLPVSAAAAMVRRVASRLSMALGVSAGAWLLSAPVVARHFGWSSVWGIVVSVPAGAASFVLVWSGLACAVLPPPAAAGAAVGVRVGAAALEELARLGDVLATRWPLGVSAHAWAGASMAVGATIWLALGRRLGSLALVAAMAGWLGLGSVVSPGPRLVVSGQPSGRGWVLAFHEGPQAGWAMVSAPDPASRGALASGLARAVAAGRGFRLRAVVVADRRSSGVDRLADRLGPAAAGAVLIQWDEDAGGLRASPGPEPFEQAVAGFVVGTTRVQLEPSPAAPRGRARRLVVVPGGEEAARALRIDARGCVDVPDWPQPVCASRQAFRLDLGDEGWERWP